MQKILVSACLLGERVRYDGCLLGLGLDHEVLRRWIQEGRVVPVCPEVAAGLAVPRPPAEIRGGAPGREVLSGTAEVVQPGGEIVTEAFVAGAAFALEAALALGIQVAVLKEGSPSCGSGSIHDGTFTGTKVRGSGVTTALLRQAGIRVFSEGQFERADRWLKDLDRCEPGG